MPSRRHHRAHGRLLLSSLLAVGLAVLLACPTASAAAANGGGAAGGVSGSATRLGSPDPLAQLALQRAELSAPDGVAGDEFGYSVAVSGDTALVGAPLRTVGGNAYEGAAYVFVRSGGGWTWQATLTASDGAAYDELGWSVALDGDTALVGSRLHGDGRGAVYVFARSGTSWSWQQTLMAPDGAPGEEFGISVTLDGDTALAGAIQHTVDGNFAQGAAYVFTRSATSWSLQAELTVSGGAEDDCFGWSVALSGDTALVGMLPFEDKGAAFVFVRSGTSWTQQAELTASDGAENDFFGSSVALEGDTAVVGASMHTSFYPFFSMGAAYVFTRSGSSWSQQAELSASDSSSDSFGSSVALDGHTALIGAPGSEVGSNDAQGTAYVFTGSGSDWSRQAELSAADGAAYDRFGSAAALDGDTVLVGAPDHEVGSDADQGAACVELLCPTASAAPVVSGNTAPGDTLSCTSGTWTVNPTPSYAYQWLSDGATITDATDASYVVQATDCEHSLSCTVTATNDAGSASTTSNSVQVPAVSPANTAAPVVSGGTALGDTLSCTSGGWSGVPTPSCAYQWLRDGATISDATGSGYTITAADRGHLLSCEVTATNAGGALSETSALVAVPAALGEPISTQAPVVSGSGALGQLLSCSSGAWSGVFSSLDHQWLRNGVAIGGATGSTYRITRADCGASLSCVVTATNQAGQTSAASNGLTAAPAPAVSLRASSRAVTTGRVLVIRGTVRKSLPTARTVCICRRLSGRLIVLRRLTLSSSGAFRCTWTSHRGGLWRFVAGYTAAGYRFTSPAVSVIVHKK